MTTDIRWRQRYQNFHRAFSLLKQALTIDEPSEVERAGMIQFFEMSFELGWKLLADYLKAEGYSPRSPRESIKTAFQAKLIEDGTTWLQALEDRNLTVHTYDEGTARRVETMIRERYFPFLISLNARFAGEASA